jgi:putative ABC transport system ATP-binding protein
MEDVIKLEKITKVYNSGKKNEVRALSDVNLRVGQGESLAIVGVSGSGKTTLLNGLACVDSFSSGNYDLFGEDILHRNDAELSAIRSNRIGYVVQEYGLLEKDKVFDNVYIPLCFSAKYKKKKARQERVLDCLQYVGLLDKVKEKVMNLSGGQKQRVAIARAMVNDPDIIIADEPTAALDSKTKKEVMDVLLSLTQKCKTVIVVTHDNEVASWCSKVMEIKDGKIFEQNPVLSK